MSEAHSAIGGQALPEGVLVRTPRRWAVAVRRPDGGLHTEAHDVPERWTLARRSVLRGLAALAEALSVGIQGLRIAVKQTSGVEASTSQIGSTLAAAGVGALAIFIVAPGVFVAALPDRAADVIEAGARAAVLVVYLLAVSRSPSARRLFSYHGAEHKVIAAFEAKGAEATVEDALRTSPIHPRCGTSFIATFVIVAAVVHSFVPRAPLVLGAVWRVALFPVDAAIAYELMRFAARWQRSVVGRVLSWPGRLLQRITTREPSAEQLDVARAALGSALR